MAKEDVKFHTREDFVQAKRKNKIKKPVSGKEVLLFPEIPRKEK